MPQKLKVCWEFTWEINYYVYIKFFIVLYLVRTVDALIVPVFRSSCSQLFFKIDVQKFFATFTGKHLCWSLFLKNPTQVFTEIVCEIFRNRFFIEHFWCLLLKKCFITIHSTENTSNREEILNGKLHFLCNKASIIFWAYLYFIKIICRVWDRYRISSNKHRPQIIAAL